MGKIEQLRPRLFCTPTMSSSSIFRSLLPEGWFVSVVGTDEDSVSVTCKMFSRDYDEETGYTDIVLCDADSEPNTSGLHCVARFHASFELRDSGPAFMVQQDLPPSWGYREMPRDMANAIGALITPANFPQAAEWLRPEEEYPEDEDARSSFWAAINQQVSSMTAAGDPWGALKVQTEAVNKLINWTDPLPEEDHEIPEPKLEDMMAPTCDLLEKAYADEGETDDETEDYLPEGSHLLPEDFQNFLRNWNKTIADSTGDWLGESRQTYRRQNPEKWQQYRVELKRLSACYQTEVAAVKNYQASTEDEDAI